MNWKKRGQAGWTGKKFAKNETKGRERQYGDKETKQQLQEDLEGDEYRYTGGKKKKNKIDRLKYWLDYYERGEKEAKERGDNSRWFGFNSYRQLIKETKQEIEEMEKCKQKV